MLTSKKLAVEILLGIALLAIVALLASVTMFIGWAVSWYLEINATKKGE